MGKRTVPGQGVAGATSRRAVALAAKDYALKNGIAIEQFQSVDDLIAAVKAHQSAAGKPAGGSKQGNAAQEAVADKIAPPQAANKEGAAGEKPKGGGGGGGTKSMRAVLITNGMDAGIVGKMDDAQVKAAYEQTLKTAAEAPVAGSDELVTNVEGGDKAVPSTEAKLDDPPKEPIKAGGNKRGGGRKGAAAAAGAGNKGKGKGKGKAAATAGDSPPPEVEASDDIEPPQEPSQTPQKPPSKDQAGGAFGMFGGPKAANWGEWFQDPKKPMPENIGPGGYFKTPTTMRAVHALSKRPLLAGAVGVAAYNIGKPIFDRFMGYEGQQQQGQQPMIPRPPADSPASNYWDGYQRRLEGPAPPPPPAAPARSTSMSGGDWWDSLTNEVMAIPAGPMMRPEDTIRQIRGNNT